MPDLIIDRRDVGGAFSVDENARRLMHYRYAEREMMRAQAGWPATIGDIKVKLGLHTHAYHCSTHADSIGKRLPELRVRGAHGPYPDRSVDRFDPPSESFVKFIEMLQDEEDPLLRVAGLYRVLKPHIIANYRYHIAATDQISDAPTIRVLKFILIDEEEHAWWGQGIFEELAHTPERRREALAWQTELEHALAESGGVAGNLGEPPSRYY